MKLLNLHTLGSQQRAHCWRDAAMHDRWRGDGGVVAVPLYRARRLCTHFVTTVVVVMVVPNPSACSNFASEACCRRTDACKMLMRRAGTARNITAHSCLVMAVMAHEKTTHRADFFQLAKCLGYSVFLELCWIDKKRHRVCLRPVRRQEEWRWVIYINMHTRNEELSCDFQKSTVFSVQWFV